MEGRGRADSTPLPVAVLEFARVAALYTGSACIAGSSVLAEFVRRKEVALTQAGGLPTEFARICSRMARNDVDIFVQCTLDTESGDTRNFHPRFLEPLATRMYGLTMPELPELSQDGYTNWNSRVRLGITNVYTFRIAKHAQEVPLNIQVICVHAALRRGIKWGDYIVARFDIDVVRCYIDFSDAYDPFRIYLAGETEDSIMRGEFHYVIHPCLYFEDHLQRMYKYGKRGFKMRSLKFDPECTDEYRSYILGHYHRLYLMEYGYEIFDAMGMVRSLSYYLLNVMVLPYFDGGGSRCAEEMRAMSVLYGNALHLLENRNWILPSGEKWTKAKAEETFAAMRRCRLLRYIRRDLKKRIRRRREMAELAQDNQQGDEE